MPEKFLPFALPSIGEDEIAEVVDSLRSGWLTTGPKTKKFEQQFAEYAGCKHALAVNSATAGLHLALEAMGVGPQDRVITTPYTFTATAEVIRYLGAEPVFVDIDPATLNIDPAGVAKALKQHGRVKAIIPVHFAGQACEMSAICALADKHGVRVLEDAAHALPTTCDGRLVGSIGDATVFSFYATKTITTGEGGMVTTDDDALAKRIQVMRLHGISRDAFDRYTSTRPAWYYEVVAPGYKYNMTDIASSLGMHQLRRAHEFHQRRREIAEMYDAGLAGLPVGLPQVAKPHDTHAWHLYVLQLKLEALNIDRNRFIEKMCEAGIGTSVHFIPLHRQPYWRDCFKLSERDFPVAEDVYQRAVSLPIYPRMTDADAQRVIQSVRKILLSSQRVLTSTSTTKAA